MSRHRADHREDVAALRDRIRALEDWGRLLAFEHVADLAPAAVTVALDTRESAGRAADLLRARHPTAPTTPPPSAALPRRYRREDRR